MIMPSTYDSLPWIAITTPLIDINLLRVDASHPYDFSWGKDTSGRFMLVLKFKVNADRLKKRKLEFNEIKSDICRIDSTGEIYFQLTLYSKENADIFHNLCVDLIEKTRLVNSEVEVLSLIYSRLECWQSFFSKTRRSLLSAQEIQGLFGELIFLEECIDAGYLTVKEAIEGWQGPLEAPHDFIYGESAVEIKSIGGSSVDKVHISSELQLITHLNSLHLSVIFLAKNEGETSGKSLNALVTDVKNKIGLSELIQSFEDRLAAAGYIDIPEYDFPRFSVMQQRTYMIKDGFPRLIPEFLPDGISKVEYDLSFSRIAQYIDSSFVPGRFV